jgi:hypothetical protein
MKIFKIIEDVNNMQSIQPIDESLINLIFLRFNCESRKKEWKELKVYIYNPKRIEKDFYNMGVGIWVFNEKVLDICRTIFEMAGEILPIQVENGKKLYLLNVLDCINILDYNRAQWDYYDDGSKGRILAYKFHENRIGNESTIFKIPETCKTDIFCYTDARNEDDQFYYLYHKHKLTGLIFEEINND